MSQQKTQNHFKPRRLLLLLLCLTGIVNSRNPTLDVQELGKLLDNNIVDSTKGADGFKPSTQINEALTDEELRLQNELR